MPGDSLLDAFQEVERYLSGGLVAEELITFPEEYSFDGVGKVNFITQKLSHSHRYPVEYGQIVPARIPAKTKDSVMFAGKSANRIVGQKFGPFHNEIKFSPDCGRSAVIEPNRRPAGMKIWNLAERVFGVNLFKLWVDQATSPESEIPQLKPKGIAAIRQLPAPFSGTLMANYRPEVGESLFLSILSDIRNRQEFDISDIEWFDFKVTPSEGNSVFHLPKDNGEFLGEVSLFSPDFTIDVEEALNQFEISWKRMISPFIKEACDENLSIASNSLS